MLSSSTNGSFLYSPVDENDIGRWKFLVVAHDRHGQKAQDTLEIVVRQYSGSRLVNHQLEIKFSFVKWNMKITQSWKWKVKSTNEKAKGRE